ncbi:MAG: penicillin-binding transpeptidase domain-containing protein [Chloroflexota bacterium]
MSQSNHLPDSPGPTRRTRIVHPGIGATLGRVALSMAIGFGGLAAGAGYWQVVRSADLSSSPDDAAVIAASRRVIRGEISDRDGVRLAWSVLDANDEPYRRYSDAAMSSVVGYASRSFGSAGLERAYGAQLTGITSADPVRDLVRKFGTTSSDPQALRTTLVAGLQEAAVAALGRDRGAVVMLDPRTGEVLVLASTPVFDAAELANPETSSAAFARLQVDPASPLLPRATQGRYVPGSVFKIVTAIAGLGSGAITADTTFPEQPGAEKAGLLVSGYRVKDGHHRATGDTALDLTGATEVSCNIWYALAGLATGGDGLASWAGKLGFGAPIPFDLSTAPSQVTNGGGPLGGGFADDVELANAAYGQAETVVTPLQMALVASTVANEGLLMRPHLVLAFSGRSGSVTTQPEVWRRVLPPDLANDISVAMQQAVQGRLGRQFTAGAQVKGMTVAGKTGTAQLGGPDAPNSWFIGFAPAEKPQIAIAVVVEQGGHGSDRAAPLAGVMLRAWKAWAGL